MASGTAPARNTCSLPHVGCVLEFAAVARRRSGVSPSGSKVKPGAEPSLPLGTVATFAIDSDDSEVDYGSYSEGGQFPA
eukprot:9307881-Lingulodinium_polyedra.AAC.1